MSDRDETMPPQGGIPEAMKNSERWILWRREKRGENEKPTKVPIAPWKRDYTTPVSATDPENWTDYETASRYLRESEGKAAGLGFVLGDGIVGIDLDKCFNEKNELSDFAKELVEKTDTYVEVSPSGKGIHIIGLGKIKHSMKRDNLGLEVYSNDRYFTVTGRALRGRTEVTDIQGLLDEIYARYDAEWVDIKALLRGVGQGGRNDAGLKVATYYRRERKKEEEAMELLREWNEKNHPPMDERELEQVVRSAYRREEPYGYRFFPTGETGRGRRNIAPSALPYFDEDMRFVPLRLAEDLQRDFHFISMRDTEEFYVYRSGVYEPRGEVIIKEEAQKRLGEEANRNRIAEVVECIRNQSHREREDAPENLIPLLNGVYDLGTGTLLPHDPKYMFFSLTPVNYDPKAVCPTIDRFFEEIVNTEEDRRLLIEVAGYCLYRKYPIQTAFMAVGDASNGKSTYLALIGSFLGKENTSAVTLQGLENERFASADLFGKLANICADIPPDGLKHTATFKRLTGGDPIRAENKFKSPFTFVNHAKLLFSANQVPSTDDETDAFFRRWIILVFPNKFEGSRADPKILQKLTAPQELSGLLNKALEALKSLLKRGSFTDSRTVEEIREDYMRKASPVHTFVHDMLEQDPDSFIIKRSLYTLFCEFCRWMGLPAKSDSVFFRELPMHVRFESYRSGLKERPPALKGVRYKLELFKKATEMKDSVKGQNACVRDVDAHVNPVRDILYFFTTSISSDIEDLVSKGCIETEEVEEDDRIKKVKSTLDISDIRLALLDINADTPDAKDESMLSSVENPSSKKDEQAKSPSDAGGAPPSEELLTRESAEAVKYMKSIGLKIDTEELPIDRILRIAKDCGADTLEGADAMDITKRAVESGFEKSVATELLSKLEEQKRILKRPDGRFTTLSEEK